MSTLHRINFISKSLVMRTDLNVWFSDKFDRNNYKIVYILHGFTGDNQMQIPIDNYSMVAVMPSGMNTFYCDNYFNISSLFKKEIPDLLKTYFDLNSENNYICGQSMGGFGAMKIGLESKIFKGIVGIFGVYFLQDMIIMTKNNLEKNPDYHYDKVFFKILDDILKTNPNLNLLDFAKTYDQKLNIYVACGDKDFTCDMNLKFIEGLKKIANPNINLYTEITPNHDHTQEYWNLHVPKFLEWIDRNN